MDPKTLPPSQKPLVKQDRELKESEKELRRRPKKVAKSSSSRGPQTTSQGILGEAHQGARGGADPRSQPYLSRALAGREETLARMVYEKEHPRLSSPVKLGEIISVRNFTPSRQVKWAKSDDKSVTGPQHWPSSPGLVLPVIMELSGLREPLKPYLDPKEPTFF